MDTAGEDEKTTIRGDNFLRRTIIFGTGDSPKLETLVKYARERRWPHVNRSTIIRALVRVAAKNYNSSGFPQDTIGVHLYSLMPAELLKIEREGAVKPEKHTDETLGYQRTTIVFSRDDTYRLDEMVRVGQIHRWRDVNRSTIVRALIRIAHYYESQFGFSESEMVNNLHKTFESELGEIDKASLRPGVNPVNHRYLARSDEGD